MEKSYVLSLNVGESAVPSAFTRDLLHTCMSGEDQLFLLFFLSHFSLLSLFSTWLYLHLESCGVQYSLIATHAVSVSCVI